MKNNNSNNSVSNTCNNTCNNTCVNNDNGRKRFDFSKLKKYLDELMIEQEKKKENELEKKKSQEEEDYRIYHIVNNKRPFNDPDKYEHVSIKNEKRLVLIDVEINSINDLIKLIETNPLHKSIKYNINMKKLHKTYPHLIELNSMIGMTQIKQSIVDQILYYIQNLDKNKMGERNSGDYMHTMICGPPGTGKTEIAKLIGKIFGSLNILKKDKFKKVTRSDLIAGYLGQTAIKTKEVILDSLDGVLFIDEVYALGNKEKRDNFSKECIDTLCESLSEYKDRLMVIIAGYETEINECFFSFNQGLASRFSWRFKIDEYSGKDLHDIFVKKVKDIQWEIKENEINKEWFEKNKVYFRYFGRDIEVLFSKIKIVHSRRVFCKSETEKRIINFADLNKGFDLYLKNDDIKNRENEHLVKNMLSSMYV
jgi:hypothetical protein